MPVKQIENAGNVIKAVAAIIALFPGVVVLLGLVAIPPSLADLVKIISFSVSGIVLIAVFLMGERLQRLGSGGAALLTVAAVVLGAVSATAYFHFANSHVVSIETETGQSETYIIPLDPSDRIRAFVEPLGGDYQVALQIAPERAELKRLMVAESSSSTAVMILLLVMSQILLVAPVVAAAWKLAGTPGARPPEQEESSAGDRKSGAS